MCKRKEKELFLSFTFSFNCLLCSFIHLSCINATRQMYLPKQQTTIMSINKSFYWCWHWYTRFQMFAIKLITKPPSLIHIKHENPTSYLHQPHTIITVINIQMSLHVLFMFLRCGYCCFHYCRSTQQC